MCLTSIMYNQKKIGNQTEKEFAKMMYDKGWWVHLLNDKVNGQPFDCIMTRDNKTYFLDIKHVKDKNYFLHSRIEPNQHNAFKMLIKRKTTNCGFAIKFNDGWYFVRYQSLDLENNKTYKESMSKI